MAKMQRIFIRIDSDTGDVLRRWFNAQGTTLATAIQDFLMDEYEQALNAEPGSDEDAEADTDAKLDVEVEACPLKPAETDGGEA